MLKVDSGFSHVEVPGDQSKNNSRGRWGESLNRVRVKRICEFKRICKERNQRQSLETVLQEFLLQREQRNDTEPGKRQEANRGFLKAAGGESVCFSASMNDPLAWEKLIELKNKQS